MQQPDIYNTGTALTVGSHQVVIDKYFSHGGFAQVYTCQISPPWQNGITTACLKRVLVPDKSSLNTLRKEVDAMRKLQGIACIVSYIDSHAARSHNGNGPGYEVFVLMEYCPNKGLIDFMNSRLTDKLKEFEILNIMQQITEAVAHMHTLNPVLIHRDIKIENVLLGNENGVFKLCDFGSVSTIIQPASNIEEFQRIQDDIMKNTTPQYRAPEMLDLYKRQPINEKSDIWALGVFLYKLCFYTTPFEANAINGNLNGYNGDYAIINGIYSLPSNPPYSARLKNIITKMLVVDPKMRPNAFQLLEEICKLRGVPTPKIINPLSNNLQPIMTSSNLSSSSFANSNMANQNYSDANDTTLNGAKNLVSGQPYAFNSSTVKPVMVSPFKVNNPPYVTANNNIMTTPKRKVRPLSMYGHVDLNKSVSRDESVKNFMNEIATEQVVDLSPEGKSKDKQKQTDIHRNVSSSMDFIRSISRQNTNSSIHSRGRLDNDTGDGNNGTTLERTLSYSKHKKRSSITSIKSFITGGSMKTQPNSSSNNTMAPNNYNPGSKLTPQHSRSSSLRKSFGYSTKRNSSVDSLPPEPTLKFKHLNNSLADLKEMSPESKSTIKFPNMNSTSNSDSSKRNSSIQSRVKNLFRNTSPPPVKTAQGYGKYTDEKPKIEPSAPKSIGLTDKGNFTPNIMHYPTAPNSIKSVYSKNSQLSSKNSFPESSGSTVSTNADTESSHSKDTNKLKKRTTVLPVAKVDIGVLKAKKKPPPKPVKPSYLKSEAVNAVAGEDKRKSLIDDDLDVLEQNFKMRFPGIV